MLFATLVWLRDGNAQTAQPKLPNAPVRTNVPPKDWSKGTFEQARQAAEAGDATAQFYLGRKYELGSGVPPDGALAAKYYRMAAERGHAMGQNNLGYLYQRGFGVPQDFTEAAKWYRKSAEQGEAYGQANLGWLYEKGLGVAQSRAQAENWLRLAGDQGLPQAQYLMGYMAENQEEPQGQTVVGNYQVAAEWFQKAGAQGHVKAMLHLGDLYYYGKLGYDYQEADKWLRRAAEEGDDEAVMRLGDLYRLNHATMPADTPEAARWFRIAAEKGNPEAQYRLGCLLVDDGKIPHDAAQAETWLRKALTNGYAEASLKLALLSHQSPDSVSQTVSRQDLEVAAYRGGGETRLVLARAYEEGRGGPVDLPAAVEMYGKILNLGPDQDRVEALQRVINLYAVKRVDFKKDAIYGPTDAGGFASFLQSYGSRVMMGPDSCCQIAEMFLRGEMLPKDRHQAVDWFTRAAKDGSAAAMNRIGELWASGADGPPDVKEAVNWYRKSAALGFADAQFNLGQCYAKGEGVQSNTVEAWRWLQMAAAQNHPAASAARDQVGKRLTPEQLAEARRLASEAGKTPVPAAPAQSDTKEH